MTPEPADKSDAVTQVVANGPEDDPLDGERKAELATAWRRRRGEMWKTPGTNALAHVTKGDVAARRATCLVTR